MRVIPGVVFQGVAVLVLVFRAEASDTGTALLRLGVVYTFASCLSFLLLGTSQNRVRLLAVVFGSSILWAIVWGASALCFYLIAGQWTAIAGISIAGVGLGQVGGAFYGILHLWRSTSKRGAPVLNGLYVGAGVWSAANFLQLLSAPIPISGHVGRLVLDLVAFALLGIISALISEAALRSVRAVEGE